jgi:hypothetical protein
MPEVVRYRIKKTQFGIFLIRYRTEMMDAGVPIPVLVFWMPMPTYAYLSKTTSNPAALPTLGKAPHGRGETHVWDKKKLIYKSVCRYRYLYQLMFTYGVILVPSTAYVVQQSFPPRPSYSSLPIPTG